MDTYQRSIIHESIERIAKAREILDQQEKELRTLLVKDANDTNR